MKGMHAATPCLFATRPGRRGKHRGTTSRRPYSAPGNPGKSHQAEQCQHTAGHQKRPRTTPALSEVVKYAPSVRRIPTYAKRVLWEAGRRRAQVNAPAFIQPVTGTVGTGAEEPDDTTKLPARHRRPSPAPDQQADGQVSSTARTEDGSMAPLPFSERAPAIRDSCPGDTWDVGSTGGRGVLIPTGLPPTKPKAIRQKCALAIRDITDAPARHRASKLQPHRARRAGPHPR